MKRFFGLLLFCMILAVCCSAATVAFAEEKRDVTLTLDVAKEGEEVVAVVTLTKNDGISDLYLRVEYDTAALELVGRTYGGALASLGPQDNFEEGEYEYPYRLQYLSNVVNSDTGKLVTLRFQVKDGAKSGEHSVKLIVRQVGYLSPEMDLIYNEKYGTQIDADKDDTAGGMVVAEKTVVISQGEVQNVREPGKDGDNALVIGLAVGGAVILVGAIVVAYLVYRKKSTKNNSGK